MQYIIFDIETIPDIDLIRKIENSKEDDETVLNNFKEKNIKKFGHDFFKIIYQRIISIGALVLSVDRNFNIQPVTKLCIFGTDEKKIIHEFLFFQSVQEHCLVSYNGSKFDLPVIAARGTKHNLDMSFLNSKNKWDSYFYSEKIHIDLCEKFRFLNPSSSLYELCMLFDIIAKPDGISGKDVYSLFKENKIEDINNYVLEDVGSTYLLFLKYMNSFIYHIDFDILSVYNQYKLMIPTNKIERNLEDTTCVE